MVNSMVERATSDMLIVPDWAINLEICDICNHDPALVNVADEDNGKFLLKLRQRFGRCAETIESPAERALSLGTFEVKHEDNCQRVSDQNMSAFFDVDDILYPLSFGISAQCMKNIIDYMIEKLGIDETKVSEMCISLYKEYGTTMAGLRAIGFDFDYDDYHSFVHGRLPYELLKTDYVLRIFCIACVSGKL